MSLANLWDYHTHNVRCKHADGNIEDYIISAIEKGLCEIGISDHFPMELIPEESGVWQYAMDNADFPNYVEEAQNLREKYKDKIKVKIASEVDYYHDQNILNQYKKLVNPFLDDLDYIIGSIHVLKIDGHAVSADDDNNPNLFKKYGINNLYSIYYDQQKELAKTGYYNIIGHLDVLKKYGVRVEQVSNGKSGTITADDIWQKQLDVLDALKESNMAMEINTNGFNKPIGEQYPEDKIIKAAIERDVTIVLGSDSHSPKTIAYKFDEIIKSAKKWGLTSLGQFTKRELTRVKI